MALGPYDPFRQLSKFRKEIDSWFQEMPLSLGRDQFFGGVRIDVYETANEVVASCDLPGIVSKEDITIKIDRNVLHIAGTVKRFNDIQDEQIHRQERFVGSFERSVTLPCAVSQDDIKAVYKNGVLEVRMPKSQDSTSNRIEVEFD